MTFCDIYEICDHVKFSTDGQMHLLILKHKMLFEIFSHNF